MINEWRETIMRITIAAAVFGAAVLALYALTGCAGARSLTAEHRDLVGYWDWVESCGGFAGQCRTPESEGYIKTLMFESNRTYILYIDKVPVELGTYYMTRQEGSIIGPETVDVIVLSEGDKRLIISALTPDALELVEDCYDCFGHSYVRANP
jgi:hypothetical protein